MLRDKFSLIVSRHEKHARARTRIYTYTISKNKKADHPLRRICNVIRAIVVTFIRGLLLNSARLLPAAILR